MHVRGWRATHIPGRPARLSEEISLRDEVIPCTAAVPFWCVSRRFFHAVCVSLLFVAYTAMTPICNYYHYMGCPCYCYRNVGLHLLPCGNVVYGRINDNPISTRPKCVV